MSVPENAPVLKARKARKKSGGPPPERFVWTIDDVLAALGMSGSMLERLRRSGKFPPPDLHFGNRPQWKAATVRAWVENGGAGR